MNQKPCKAQIIDHCLIVMSENDKAKNCEGCRAKRKNTASKSRKNLKEKAPAGFRPCVAKYKSCEKWVRKDAKVFHCKPCHEKKIARAPKAWQKKKESLEGMIIDKTKFKACYGMSAGCKKVIPIDGNYYCDVCKVGTNRRTRTNMRKRSKIIMENGNRLCNGRSKACLKEVGPTGSQTCAPCLEYCKEMTANRKKQVALKISDGK